MKDRRHRFILHSDLNNFYASVECLINPKIRNNAVVVVGDEELRHGVVLAKNYVAKSVGIKTGDTVIEAQNKCIGICKLTKIKARLPLYQKVSRRVQNIYRKYTDNVEMFGIDEAWLDVTANAKDYSEALELAEMIRQEVKDTIGLTVSIGVSYNKIFAKLGSDLKKPDAITLITRGNFKDRIWPLSVNTLLFVGRATTKKLEKMNIMTIGDLARCDVKLLDNILGVVGVKLWHYANGLDASRVKHIEDTDIIKSIGNSVTWHKDLTEMPEISNVIYSLSEQVAQRLKDAKLYAKEIQIYIKDSSLSSIEHQCKLPYPTDTSADIAKNAIALFKKFYDTRSKVRAIGVRVRDFSTTLQTSLLDDGREIIKQEKLDNIVHSIRTKYGDCVIGRGNKFLWTN